MRNVTLGAALALSVLTAPSVLSAQADTAAVMAPIHRLFDGMRAHDSAAVRSVFAPGAALSSSSIRNGTPTVQSEPIDGFIAAVGRPSTDKFDERISDPVVHIDDGMAMVWVKYSFYLNDKFSHCGIDAFLLAQDTSGWKILTIGDTRRREGC
ncbi:MAG TPA: nuclear transport factor 2 family protein [Gemmatimonadales bacterium]|jgi:hypothetical protein|nr:nuclear transport factor 2 family protein [Gemmatimonadales bacterium]